MTIKRRPRTCGIGSGPGCALLARDSTRGRGRGRTWPRGPRVGDVHFGGRRGRAARRPGGRSRTPTDLPRFVYARAVDGRAVQLPQPARIKPQLIGARPPGDAGRLLLRGGGHAGVAARALPGGQITEWYPAARVRGGEIAWDAVHVRPGGSDAFPEETAASHYYAARDTDAAPVRVVTADGAQDERFLFYRGVGALQIPLLASLDRGRLLVQSFAGASIPEVVVFENRGGSMAYSVRPLQGRALAVPRPTGGQGIDGLRKELEAILVRHGLFPREAAAMVATWGDSWFEEGLRVFYVLPRGLADATLPLSIDPAPAALVRVMVVRAEILTRESEQRARTELLALADDADRGPRPGAPEAGTVRRAARAPRPGAHVGSPAALEDRGCPPAHRALTVRH